MLDSRLGPRGRRRGRDGIFLLAPGRTSVILDQYILDASAFAGEMVQLRIVDNASGGWKLPSRFDLKNAW